MIALNWIKEKFFPAKPAPKERQPSARSKYIAGVSQRIVEKADVVNEELARYASARDPFMAMFSDAILHQQIKHIPDEARDHVRRTLRS